MKNFIHGKLIYGHSLQALVLYAADWQLKVTTTWHWSFYSAVSCLRPNSDQRQTSPVMITAQYKPFVYYKLNTKHIPNSEYPFSHALIGYSSSLGYPLDIYWFLCTTQVINFQLNFDQIKFFFVVADYSLVWYTNITEMLVDITVDTNCIYLTTSRLCKYLSLFTSSLTADRSQTSPFNL